MPFDDSVSKRCTVQDLRSDIVLIHLSTSKNEHSPCFFSFFCVGVFVVVVGFVLFCLGAVLIKAMGFS